jgi:hypothetical protein
MPSRARAVWAHSISSKSRAPDTPIPAITFPSIKTGRPPPQTKRRSRFANPKRKFADEAHSRRGIGFIRSKLGYRGRHIIHAPRRERCASRINDANCYLPALARRMTHGCLDQLHGSGRSQHWVQHYHRHPLQWLAQSSTMNGSTIRRAAMSE